MSVRAPFLRRSVSGAHVRALAPAPGGVALGSPGPDTHGGKRAWEDWTPLPDTTATGEEPLTPGLGKGRKGARGAATAERSVAFEAMRVYIYIYIYIYIYE